MKKLFVTAAALAITASGAFAQQAVLGTGAFSSSTAGFASTGTSLTGAGSIGPGVAISGNEQTSVGAIASSGLALAATNGVTSGAVSETVTVGGTSFTNISGAASTGQAGGFAGGAADNLTIGGSDANAFGGFGISLN